MKRLHQFCFHPYGKDRLVMAWIAAFCVILAASAAAVGFSQEYWILGGANVFFMIWNLATFGINRDLYMEWKKKQPPA